MTDRLLLPIDPTPAQAPRLGLVTSAIEVTPEQRSDAGITYAMSFCGTDGESTGEICAAPNGGDGFTATGVSGGIDTFKPVLVGYTATCGPESMSIEELTQKVQREFARRETRIIEKEFVGGAVSEGAYSGDNFYLARDGAILKDNGNFFGVVNGLALLEQLAYDNEVERAMIWAPPLIVTYLQHMNLVRREGNLLLTALDSIVVPTGGDHTQTPGTPASHLGGADQFVYMTPLVELRRNPIQVNTSEYILNEDGSYENGLRATVYRTYETNTTGSWDCAGAYILQVCSTQDCDTQSD